MLRSTWCALWLALTLSLLTACGGGGPVSPPVNPDGQPGGYKLLIDGKVCRWAELSFPLRVYVDPPPASAGGYGPALRTAAINAIDMWDGIIASVPNLFDYEPVYDAADIIVRWEPMKVDGYTRAVEYADHVAIHKIAISDAIRDPASVDLIMRHELGHVLGLGHSSVPGDMMASPLVVGKTGVTDRDTTMLNWLYTQPSYLPIKTY